MGHYRFQLTPFQHAGSRLPQRMGEYALQAADDGLTLTRVSNPLQTLRVSNAVFRDQGGSEQVLPVISESITPGEASGKWLGAGTVVTRAFGNDERTVSVTVTLGSSLEIGCSVEYHADVQVELEGFRFETDTGFEFDGRDVQVSGDFINASADGLFTAFGSFQHKVLFLEDGTQTFLENQPREEGEVRTARLRVGGKPALQLLVQPDGRDATFGLCDHWHVESNDALTAIMWGASSEEHEDYGVRGFVSRGVNLTMSAYGNNTHGTVNRSMSDPITADILRAMSSAGIEIVHHTIFPGTDKRSDALVWMPVFHEEFGGRSWTDHNLAGGQRTVGLASLGWDEDSPNEYIMDLIEQYGIEYGWNYQDDNERGSINQLHGSRFGFPKDLLYQHEQLVLPVSGELLWLFRNSDRPIQRMMERGTGVTELEGLIRNRGISMGHEYVGTVAQDGDNYHSGEVYVISDALDDLLAFIEASVASGSLWNPVQSVFNDRMRMLLDVDVTDSGAGFTVSNDSGGVVSGCSFYLPISGATPSLGGVPMNRKGTSDGGTICWADLPPGDSTITL